MWEAEHNLLVFNYNVSKAPLDDSKEFLETEMKVTGDTLLKLHLKRATRLGKGKNNQPPPLLLQFSHPSDRNTVLNHSKNLKNKQFRIEKDVPKLYKKAHSEFKEEAWKLREHFGYQTNITFSGHLMILQFRTRNSDSEKFHYINIGRGLDFQWLGLVLMISGASADQSWTFECFDWDSSTYNHNLRKFPMS